MLKKVIYILAIVILQFLNTYPQPTWEKIKTPTDFNLLKVFYLDSLHCWVAGDSGIIMFSSDQGKNWQMQNSGVSNYISDIYFLNENLGWAVAFELEEMNIRSKILKTTNGGSIWQNDNYRHLNIILTTIFFIDSLNGWIGKNGNGINYTTDSGSNWYESVILDTGSFAYLPIEKIGFSTPQYGFAVGGHRDAVGVVWSTSDSGKIWIPHGIGADFILDFIFLDTTRIISLTAEYEGAFPNSYLDFDLINNSWTYDSLSFYAYITGMSKRNYQEIWCASSRLHPGFVYREEQDSEWSLFTNSDSSFVNDVDFADSLNGISVSNSGYILKYIPEKPVSVENVDSQIALDFILEQNYPNPFNPATKIRWECPISGHNTLKVYDVLGIEIATLVDEYKPAGNYEVEFMVGQDSSPDIASGIYFYQLKTENYFETKKMLLLK